MQEALSILIFRRVQFTDEEKTKITAVVEGLKNKCNLTETAHNDPSLKSVQGKLQGAINTVTSNGPTAELWVQYFSAVNLVKHVGSYGQNYVEFSRISRQKK